MKPKFEIGQSVRTTVVPYGEETVQRGYVRAIHEPYEFKDMWERESSVRQNYVIESTTDDIAFVMEERDLVDDPTQYEELRGTIHGRGAAETCNRIGVRAFFNHFTLDEHAEVYCPMEPPPSKRPMPWYTRAEVLAQREAFKAAFHKFLNNPAVETNDEESV